MLKKRDYQEEIVKKTVQKLQEHRFVYLAMEVRTGKTLTALWAMEEMRVNHVLFVTKKKAISSIQADYDLLSPDFNITIINPESLHKVDLDPVDALVMDEAHIYGAFPKPSGNAKKIKEIIIKTSPYIILLSGTPTPESFSQLYHQVYAIPGNPFEDYANFYRFADDHVNKKQKKINGFMINDYSRGLDSIIELMEPHMISYTQKQAGFEGEIEEDFIFVDLDDYTRMLIRRLKRDQVVEGKEEVILADTGAKMMGKIHQLCSGTIKFESGNSKVVSTVKAKTIKWKFEGEKIGIFYKYTAELDALEEVFGDDLTTDIDEFNDSHKSIALQIQAGREGISLRNAKYLVFYNIDFSATSYWQARDRMTTKDRTYNKVYWVFSNQGIEKDIYRTVCNKKNYTLRHFRKNC